MPYPREERQIDTIWLLLHSVSQLVAKSQGYILLSLFRTAHVLWRAAAMPSFRCSALIGVLQEVLARIYISPGQWLPSLSRHNFYTLCILMLRCCGVSRLRLKCLLSQWLLPVANGASTQPGLTDCMTVILAIGHTCRRIWSSGSSLGQRTACLKTSKRKGSKRHPFSM